MWQQTPLTVSSYYRYKWHRRLLVYTPTFRDELNDTVDSVDGNTKSILYYTTYFG